MPLSCCYDGIHIFGGGGGDTNIFIKSQIHAIVQCLMQVADETGQGVLVNCTNYTMVAGLYNNKLEHIVCCFHSECSCIYFQVYEPIKIQVTHLLYFGKYVLQQFVHYVSDTGMTCSTAKQ